MTREEEEEEVEEEEEEEVVERQFNSCIILSYFNENVSHLWSLLCIKNAKVDSMAPWNIHLERAFGIHFAIHFAIHAAETFSYARIRRGNVPNDLPLTNKRAQTKAKTNLLIF
ncbi:hypothetical protein M0804_011400 [Polistes exclamans]|nr:hypothetical protein M0804_011400 [Polistes exclamans]